MQKLDDQTKHQCAVNAAVYEHRLQVSPASVDKQQAVLGGVESSGHPAEPARCAAEWVEADHAFGGICGQDS